MADVYKVAVSIALRTNAAQVLGVLGKDLLGIKLKATEAEASLSRVGAAVLGIGGIAAGSAVLAGMVRLVEHGREFVHQQSLMAQAGISQVDIANATAAAWKTAGDVIGSSAEKNLALIADLRNRLGSMTEAVQAAPSMSRLGVVLQNLTGQDQEKAGDAAARFLEQRGSLVDPKTGQISRALLEHGGNLVAAISAGTRGRVGPDQLLAFQTYARLAGAQLSEQGLLNMVPIIGASRSASSVGTQLSSLENQLIGGVMTNASAHWLERLGVVDSKRVHEGRGGRMQFDAGALIDTEMLRRDPRGWLHRYLGGGLLKEGYATGDAQAGAVLQSHLRSTVTGLIGEILRSYAAFAKDSTLLDASVKTNQFAVAQATDPTTKMAAFSTAWQNLLTSLGAPLVNDATGAIGKLTGALTRLDFLDERSPARGREYRACRNRARRPGSRWRRDHCGKRRSRPVRERGRAAYRRAGRRWRSRGGCDACELRDGHRSDRRGIGRSTAVDELVGASDRPRWRSPRELCGERARGFGHGGASFGPHALGSR